MTPGEGRRTPARAVVTSAADVPAVQEGTVLTGWEEPRDCTWPHASPARPARRPGGQGLYQRWQGAWAPTLQRLAGLAEGGDRSPSRGGTWVPPGQPQAPGEQERALSKSSLPSGQLEETTEAPTSHNSDLRSGRSPGLPRSSGQAGTLGSLVPGKGHLPAAEGLSQDSPIVFLMESNPRGLYIFSFNLGHFVSLSENVT